MFSMCFPNEVFDYGLLMDSKGGTNGVTLDDAYIDKMDMIGIGRILDAAPHGPHSSFDLFGVSMLELDGDDSITDVATPYFTSIEGASIPWTYLFLLTLCPGLSPAMMLSPTTQIHDIDDVGNPDGPLSGQSDCDSDSEERKVTPISGSTESVDFETSDQPMELKIGSSFSLDERSRLIDLLRSYLDEEIQKQLSVGFLSVVEYPEWLANVVPVPKKDGKVRVCVDFRDLNKASPKDDFRLPHIDMLHAFEKIKECLLSPPVLVPPTPDMALGCMLAQLNDLGKERAIYYLSKRMLDHQETEALHDRVLHMFGLVIRSIKISYIHMLRVENQFVDALATLKVIKWHVVVMYKPISSKSSSGHEYILVAIDYFTKWVEVASYAILTAKVAKFIISHIIYRYGIPHELISDRGVHFEVNFLCIMGISHIISHIYKVATLFSLVYDMEVIPC
ncbi:hypothetical protein AAG906_023585 [Vitis piasezkii]